MRLFTYFAIFLIFSLFFYLYVDAMGLFQTLVVWSVGALIIFAIKYLINK